MVRVVLADDHRLFREGLRSLLVARGVQVVGEAADGAQAVALARDLRPAVVLMDLDMPGVDGLTATRLIKAELPDLHVVVLTASEAEADLFEAVKSGAQGYLLKSLDPDTLVDMVHAAARGEAAVTPDLAAKILAEFARLGAAIEGANPPAPKPSDRSSPSPSAVGGRHEGEEVLVEPLTAREREVLELLVAGASNKEIARRLVVSENTVKYHLKNILQKLHAHNRSQVVAYALRHGLTRGPQTP